MKKVCRVIIYLLLISAFIMGCKAETGNNGNNTKKNVVPPPLF